MAHSKYLFPNKREVFPNRDYFSHHSKTKGKNPESIYSSVCPLCLHHTFSQVLYFPEDISVHGDGHAISLTHRPISSSTLMIFASIPLKLPLSSFWRARFLKSYTPIFCSLYLNSMEDCIFEDGCNNIFHPTLSSSSLCIIKGDIASLCPSWYACSLNPAAMLWGSPCYTERLQWDFPANCTRSQLTANISHQKWDWRSLQGYFSSSIGNSMRDLSENCLAKSSQFPEP